MEKDPAPIVLFAYNRPWHLQRTVEAIRANELAANSRLIVHSDGPRNDRDRDAVNVFHRVNRGPERFDLLTGKPQVFHQSLPGETGLDTPRLPR